MSTPVAVAPWRLRLRLALFVLGASYLLLGPVPHQVFDAPYTKLLPRWRMFSGMSLQECAGHFERRDQGATVRLDDWYDLLALDRHRRRDRDQARVRSVTDAEQLGERLCKKLGGGADVRLFLRCPSKHKGWVPRAQGERNLCEPRASSGTSKRQRIDERRRATKGSPR
jgi:hypothetical protein